MKTLAEGILKANIDIDMLIPHDRLLEKFALLH